MKDANENILKVLVNNVQESVDFLEKSLGCLTQDICMPTSECFTNLNAETGSYDIIWHKSDTYNVNVLKCLVGFCLVHFQLIKHIQLFQKSIRSILTWEFIIFSKRNTKIRFIIWVRRICSKAW